MKVNYLYIFLIVIDYLNFLLFQKKHNIIKYYLTNKIKLKNNKSIFAIIKNNIIY